MCTFIKESANTDYIDLVVASHLHNDHISGLTKVLSGLQVGTLAIHCPWDYTKSIQRMTQTTASPSHLKTQIERSVLTLSSLVDLAEELGIKVIQPFAGEEILNGLFVLGPTEEYYQDLLANFNITPEVKAGSRIDTFIKSSRDAVINWIDAHSPLGKLSDDYPDTSPENNSSLVLLLQINEKKFLFTGDAGKDALTRSINFAESEGISLANIDFFDIPHHGSRRNLGQTILNRLMPKNAFISCPPEGDPKHPSRRVVNALIERDCHPCSTKGGGIYLHSKDTPQRDGWNTAQPLSFYDQVEE